MDAPAIAAIVAVVGILAVVTYILAADALSSAEASQLRGRLGFSNSQTFGREGAFAYRPMNQAVVRLSIRLEPNKLDGSTNQSCHDSTARI